MKLVTIVASVIFLLGCSSSSPIETKYYLLNSPTSLHEEGSPTVSNDILLQKIANKEKILITINTADYLQQPFLVMQIDQHTLHYAQSHLWADPLHKEISNAITADLNAMNTQSHFVVARSHQVNKSFSTLTINIEHFHASDTGNVILSGNFKKTNINDTHSSSISHSNEHNKFYLEQALTEDGYTHAVFQMRKALKRLALKIIQSHTHEHSL